MENITAKYIKVGAAHSIVAKSKKRQKPHNYQQAEQASLEVEPKLQAESERKSHYLSQMKLALKAISRDLTCTCNNRTTVDMGSIITRTLVNLRSPWVHSQAT